jgi:hypothetical protein
MNKNVRSLLFTGAHIGSANKKQTIQYPMITYDLKRRRLGKVSNNPDIVTSERAN